MLSPPTYRPSWAPTRQERNRAYKARRTDREEQRFYTSPVWRKLREIKLCNNPYCEQCLVRGVHTPATIVHHKVEVKTDPTLALDLETLVSACKSCHSRIHATDTSEQ